MSVATAGVSEMALALIDNDVDAAEVCGRLVDGLFHRGFVADVDDER